MTMIERADEVAVLDRPDIPGLRFRRPVLPADWAPLAEIETEAHVADGVKESATPATFAHDWSNLPGVAVERDMIVAEVDGKPVAHAVGRTTVRDGVAVGELSGTVLPEFRRRGIGTALHRTAREQVLAKLEAEGHPGPRELRVFGMDSEAGAVALFEREGFVRIRHGFEMRRDLGAPIPEVVLPPGIDIRPVTEAQHRAIHAADDEAFRDHWGHRESTESDFRALFEHPETDTSLWRVGWAGDEVAGVVMNMIFRPDNERFGFKRGWLDRVSVRRPWRGIGLGRALVTASLHALRDAGMDEAWLGVDGANATGALRLYEVTGFEVANGWSAWSRPVDGPAPEGWSGVEAP